MDESSLIEEEDFASVAEENDNFRVSLRQSDGFMAFLHRSNVIYARSVAAEDADQDVFLDYKTDIDGCVVEVNSWRGIRMPVRHLTVFHKDHPRLMRSFLKKHVNLKLYTMDQLSSFRHSVGFQLFYEYGWEGWLGIIPSSRNCRSKLDAQVMSGVGKSYFQKVRVNFQKKLFGERMKVYRTLSKNDMNDVRTLFVLPDDQDCILGILQDAIDATILPKEFERLQFCFRFGDKSRNGIKLDGFELSEVKRVTVHSAIDISSDVFDLMWSMTGLQDIVGNRGVLSTCLSFRDCGNYQSNLDGRLLDIGQDLRDVCNTASGDLRFIQLYVDVPHRKPKSRFHPVSACIAGGLVFHKDTFSAFTRDAKSYISTLESNFCLMDKGTCRLEVVQEASELKECYIATDFINVDNLFLLLKNRPLLVPFEKGMVAAVQSLGMCMASQLKVLLEKYSRTGNIEATWKAYQFELAAEKLLWGGPFSSMSKLLSVNLGPGMLEGSRSLTEEKGFLAFERWTACMANEYSIPPCCVWTTSEVMQRKIRRVVGLHDVLGSCPFVVGRRLVHTLVMDLHEAAKLWCRLEEFQGELFDENGTMFRVNGAMTVKRLSELLSSNRRIGVHMVFGYQCQLIRKSQLDLTEVLLDGLNDMRLKRFPALKLWDVHGNPTLSWDKQSGVWEVCYNTERQVTGMRQNPMTLTQLIITELEFRRLVYASKLKSVPVSFPWIATCVRKLSRENLTDEQMVCVMSFISCIALIMNGWYVEYDRLKALYDDLPVTQHRLKDLEIQSKLLLSQCKTVYVFRLHHSIGWRLLVPEKKESGVIPKEPPETGVTEEETIQRADTNVLISDDIPEDNIQSIKRRASTCVPLSKGRWKWCPEEIEIMYKISGNKGNREESWYEVYKKECLNRNIPFHGKEAFRRKVQRVVKDINNSSK